MTTPIMPLEDVERETRAFEHARALAARLWPSTNLLGFEDHTYQAINEVAFLPPNPEDVDLRAWIAAHAGPAAFVELDAALNGLIKQAKEAGYIYGVAMGVTVGMIGTTPPPGLARLH